ncbi:MAG: molybdenum ABC transporter ATP-binding protein [Nitrospinae bacterium]|nr:molybdenum ABC transporter ATP-binding protein [Nitrospinota bacterium]
MIRASFQTRLPSGFELKFELEAPETGFTAIFGPSGSGKTTAMRCMAGLHMAEQGYFRVGQSTWQESARELFTPPHQRAVGYVFQDARLFPHLTARDNLMYGHKRIPGDRRKIEFAQVAEWLGLEPLLDRWPESLSGGQKQRVAIGRALLTSPELMLFDEPLASLDAEGKREILAGLEILHTKLSIPAMYVTHSLDEALRLADHIAVVQAGNTIASGPAIEMAARIDLPLGRGDDAGAVIESDRVEHDGKYALTWLYFDGGKIAVPLMKAAAGSRARARILARDVGLALQRPERTSLLNILEARVERIATLDEASVMVRLMVGGTPLLSKITRKSAETLELREGTPVYAMVKSVSMAKQA